MQETKRSLQVFLCHASGDKPTVKKLYNRLKKDGIDAWLDKEKLIPGQNWQIEIPKAVYNSDVVIVCLSSQSVTKEGFVQKEIKFALDAADEKPDGTIFIIPARLENCNVPERINKFHWVDLFSDDGYERILKALQIRADSVGATITSQKSKNTKASNKADVAQKFVKDKKKLTKPISVTPPPKTEHPRKIFSEKAFDKELDQTKSFLPFESKCNYFGRELQLNGHPDTWNIKNGILSLTQGSFAFTSEDFSFDVQFSLIRSIESKWMPPFMYPLNTKYIVINYYENLNPINVYLQPTDKPRKVTANKIDINSNLEASNSDWQIFSICLGINMSVDSWIAVIKETSKLSQKLVTQK